jgi:hypothetical protein
MHKAVRIIVISLVAALLVGCSATRHCPSVSVQANQAVKQPPTASVRLNYLYLTLDAETFEAISESAFMRNQFCRFGQSTAAVVRRQGWSATYLLGEDTCVELLAPGGPEANIEGNGGICFSTVNTGDINVIYDNLRNRLGPDARKGIRTFNTGEKNVPWFSYVSSHGGREIPPLVTWVTEQDASFRDSLGYRSSQRATPPEVEAAAAQDKTVSDKRLLRDITGVTLVLTQAELDRLAAELSAYGYVKRQAADLTIFSGPGFEVRVAISDNPEYRIRSLSCALTGEPNVPAQIEFGGKATLTLAENAAATWTFGPKPQQLTRN